jgi:hypothetical protein
VKNYREEMAFYDLLAQANGGEPEKVSGIIPIDVDNTI